jgi:protein SCO1
MQRTLLASIALFATLTVSMPGTIEAQSGRWGKDYFPNLPVVTQDGKTLQFYDDVVKGKIVVMSFIYTSCRDICPMTTSRLAQIEEKLGDRVGRDIFINSISVDPENDTPDRLKKYAEAFHAGPGWLFLTGKLADIRAINGKFGERMRSLSEHRNEIVLGNDTTGEWQRDNVFNDLDRVITAIRAMDPKWREQVRTPTKENAAMRPIPLNGPPGQSLFVKLCAGCHTVGQGDKVGPDLNGVTDRHGRAWISNYVRDPEKMRAQNDPDALALFAKYPDVRMPKMGLSENDAADLISYVELQMYRLSAPQSGSQGTSAPPHHHH